MIGFSMSLSGNIESYNFDHFLDFIDERRNLIKKKLESISI